MTLADRIRLDVDDGLAHMRMVAPDRHNAIDPAWVQALGEATDAIEGDASVRAVLITADGPSFTVGGDLKHFTRQADRLPDALDEMIAPFHATLARLGALPVPIVTAAQGPTAGGGLGLLWAADIVLVANDVKLAAGFPRLALSGDGGSAWTLVQLVGLRRAQRFVMGGEVLGAEQALEWGIASEVVPAGELAARALAEGRRLAAGPTVAYGHMRRLLRNASSMTWPDYLQAEYEAIVQCGAAADAREGVVSFTERRGPQFLGR